MTTSDRPRPAGSPFAPMRPEVFGKYVLQSRLGEGGMAEVFLAVQSVADGVERRVAIKRILPAVARDPTFVQMFLSEARLAAQISHANITHLYDFGQVGDAYYMAIEYVPGCALSALLRTVRLAGLPCEVAARIAAGVAEGLFYAHRLCDPEGRPLGVVHRDVSPQNILVSTEGTVKLTDFGIAKATLTMGEHTASSILRGKWGYMSPEHCHGMPLDQRSDIFSLGIVLYEMLVGRRCYAANSPFDTMRAVIEGGVPSAQSARPDVPGALEAIVHKALAKLPADRFQTAGEMQMALESYLSSLGVVCNSFTIAKYLAEQLPADLPQAAPRERQVTPSTMIDARPAGEARWETTPTQLQRPHEPVRPANPPRSDDVSPSMGRSANLQIRVATVHDVTRARLEARRLCEQSLGASNFAVQKVTTVVSELARNLVQHAGGGIIELRPLQRGSGPGRIIVKAIDTGPGMRSSEDSQPRRRRGAGPSHGLEACKQMANRLDIQTGPVGTTVEAEIWL